MSTCPACKTIYHDSPGAGCPNCRLDLPELREVQECECGKFTSYLCPECGEPCCMDCIVKSEWSACIQCSARLLAEAQAEAKFGAAGIPLLDYDAILLHLGEVVNHGGGQLTPREVPAGSSAGMSSAPIGEVHAS